MPTVYMTTPLLQARVTGSRIELDFSDVEEPPDPAPGWIPLTDVEQVVVDSQVRFSSRSVALLARRGIPVLFLSNGHFPSGMAVPLRRQTRALARQLDASRDDGRRLQAARWLVEAKILNMRRILQRLTVSGHDRVGTLGSLKALAKRAARASTLDALRGYEGSATGQYFTAWGRAFPTTMPFERRTRRPPRNEVNALMSFLYTVLCAEFELHLYGIGLEPGWGVFHETDEGRPALALDLMEPFRAPLVDSVVLDMANHGRITPEDFHQVDEGYLLRQESRRKVFVQWENRLEREFNYTREERRTTLRNLIKEHCEQAKLFFREGRRMRPFRMN